MTSQPFPDIPGFTIRRSLGEGHSGRVYLAEASDPELPDLVALKVLRERGQLRETEIRRFVREGRLGTRLAHPNILPVYRLIEWRDTFVLVMELAEGQNFKTWRPRKLLQGQALLKTRLTALAKIARALDAAHAAGVIHRDVKPANIQVRQDGEPFLIDFGLAREELQDTTLTASHVLMGTPLYMAPELIAGRAHEADARCDVYGLGVTLYEAVAGHPPFSGRTREELWSRVLRDDPPRLTGQLPAGLEAVTLRALEKNPVHRQRSAGELAQALERIASGMDPDQSSVGLLLRRQGRALLRQRLPIAVVLLIALACTTWVIQDSWQLARYETELQRGDRALDNGDLNTALKHYDVAIQDAPDRPGAHLRRAAAYGNFELLNLAASSVESAIELGYDPGLPGARSAQQHFYTGLHIAARSSARDGANELTQSVAADPDSYDAYGPLHQLQRGLGQLDAAAQTLASWRGNLKGKDPRSALVSALTLEEEGDVSGAIAALLTLESEDDKTPADFWRHRNLGRFYLRLGQFDKARVSLRAAVEIVSMDAASWHNLAVLDFRLGRLSQAEDLALVALRLAPRLVRSLLLLATCAQHRGDLKGALTLLDTHGFTGRGSEPLLRMRADLLYATAQEHDAAEQWDAARGARQLCIAANPEHLGALSDLAFDSWYAGDYAAGLTGFSQARALWWLDPKPAQRDDEVWRRAYGNRADLLNILVALFSCAAHTGHAAAAADALREFDEQSEQVADIDPSTRLNLAEALATVPIEALRDGPRALALIDSQLFHQLGAADPQVAALLELIRESCR
ncbi:MAG: tetratricopeptide (TPR) repeat protein/tRNA A-37 threonylcarbamoyl transferase component Bud32 [Pseudohongiellaceae bacterium]|jgi:tetratricopeptide (TPR) repeat protein/tRNA A-37 threonylcarbamoyl transferase component Bud32